MSITRISAVLWSFALLALTTSTLNIFGDVPLSRAVWVPLTVGACSLLTTLVIAQFRQHSMSHPNYEDLSRWQNNLVYVQIAIGTVWGIAPWLLWQDGNLLNHVFLAGTVVVLVANFVVSRANHSILVLSGVIPAAGIPALRYALSGGRFDLAIALVLPLIAYQLYRDGRRMTRRMEQDSRLRFQVEDLARELEETRDEALRKRFEAETANASKTAFLANMSHELRTPLNAILGFSEIIEQECFGPVGSPRYREYAGDIHSSGAHLLSLINDLLDVAKIEAGKMEIQPHRLDAAQAFDVALKLIVAKARERLQDLTIEIDPSAPALYADERALKQIMINLVSNAVKFTPEGGRIAVLGSLARDGGFQITVRDNGPGIPREKLDKIFSPFNQVDNRYDRQAGGTGLGLALVRGLAELHGGRAWIESEPGRGCAAFVVLPCAPQAADGPHRADARAA